MPVLLLAAVAGFMLFAYSPGWAFQPGKIRWPIKTSVPDNANLDNPTPVDLADIIDTEKLPSDPLNDVTKDDHRYQDTRIPHFDNSLNVTEGDILSTTGWLHLVAAESDGDYHIQLSTHQDDGDNCLIVEVPMPDPDYVSDRSLHPSLERVRNFIKGRLLRGREPSARGSVLNHPACVTLTGQLFYDDAHVGDPPRGKKQMKAATLWELHPVTAITFSRDCTP